MFRQIVDTLVPTVEEREARALAFVVLEDAFGLSRTDIYLGKDTAFSEDDTIRLEKILRRLEQGEPVQYAIGTAQFCDLTFRVTPDTLIPRPETEELVGWVASLLPSEAPCSVLDVGTGTGCIAISLAKQFPRAQVTAWDISEEALAVAQQNAETNGVTVDFCQKDVLEVVNESAASAPSSDALYIVSNPPYICERERAEMEAHVLDYEPASALFVPDADPLLFYRALARLGQQLKATAVLVEINQAYGQETVRMFQSSGYSNVELHRDIYGKDRMIKAVR
ncbi:peptide chain release factor N(5)-glutamine methyltransferase [uncultured Alloprevotella sp.]|uniref:peptide chain release factor N(5)-glutamine methyltransferase n=1 Tax=uncultured Alloprevotella sp. TaxID=1283315 RepID=UPI00325FAC82